MSSEDVNESQDAGKPKRRKRTEAEKAAGLRHRAEVLVSRSAKALLLDLPAWSQAISEEKEINGMLHRCRLKISKQALAFDNLWDKLDTTFQTLEDKHAQEKASLQRLLKVKERKAVLLERAIVKSRHKLNVQAPPEIS